MRKRSARIRALVLATVVAALVAGVAVGTTSAGAARSVRGFDGSTIKVAGFGIAAQLPTAESGAQARIKRFNDTNEIKGVKIQYAEFADDKQDPATALTEARRLVTQQQVFAIVGDVSQFNPKDYFTQQHLPYFGWGFDDTYCSHNPSTKLWGFAFSGCGVPSDPSFVGESARAIYQYAKEKTGKDHPTAALIGNDTTSSKNAAKFSEISWTGIGFKVVGNFTQMPIPPIADYTPYAQAALTADNGKAPDVIACLLATDCIPLYAQIQANNYPGIYMSSLYSNLLVGAFKGSTVNTAFVNPTTSTPGMDAMKKDLNAWKAGEGDKVDSGTIAGYTSTDMFIQALKTAAKKGKSNITPEAVQAAAAKQTWELKGVAGPTSYPKATVNTYPNCNSLFSSDGAQWTTVVDYGCSTKTYPVK
jgi:ABC-type branched-subunit amino acid transport system substrate-binding protein